MERCYEAGLEDLEISKWTARVSEWLGERYSHRSHSGRRTCKEQTTSRQYLSVHPVQQRAVLTGIGADGGERRGLARALDVREAFARGQVCGLRGGGGGDGDDLGAVSKQTLVLTEEGQLEQSLTEPLLQLRLIVWCEA